MLDSIIRTELTLSVFLICTAVSLILGIGVACVGMYRSRSTPSFAITLAILPAVVQLVILLVNGSLNSTCGQTAAKDALCPSQFPSQSATLQSISEDIRVRDYETADRVGRAGSGGDPDR